MSTTIENQRCFTEQAEDIFWENLEKENWCKLEQLSSDFKETIKYLNDSKISISLGYEMKRYICENLATGKDEYSNKYIVEIKIKDKIKKFILDNFDDVNCDLEEYALLIVELAKNINIKTLRKNTVLDWLKGNCTRSTVIEKLSFILDMNVNEVSIFLHKVLGERGYNFKDFNEIIYYFCLNNKLKVDEAKELIKYYKRKCEEIKKYNNESKHTTTLKEEILNIKDKEELIEYLIKNNISLNKINNSINTEFKNIYEEVIEILQLIYKDINCNRDTVEKLMFSGIPIKDKISGAYSSIIKNDKINKFLKNIINRDKVDKIYEGKRQATRKDLIMINFFRFSLLVSGYEELINSEKYGDLSENLSIIQKKEPIQNMLGFRDEMDEILLQNDMGTLYIPNRFDNFILLSLCYQNPYEHFSDVVESTFEEGEE